MMNPNQNEVRVLHLITRFLNGGAETTTENAICALDESGEKFDIRLGFGNEYDKTRVSSLRSKGVDTVVFQFIRHYNPIAAIIAVVEVARYLSRENIHILHTHSTEAGVIGRLAAIFANTPVVVHEIHGDPITMDRNKVLNWVLLLLERFCATVTTRLVVKSERIRDLYLRRGIGRLDQYELIYHGVDIEKFKNADQASDGGSDTRISLIFIGRLEEGKGLFDLIEAFEVLAEKHTVELLIVGDGPLTEPVQKEIVKRGLEDHVRLLGYRTDIPELLKSADIFVLPSYREGTPRVITEALSSGLPVISTNISGIPDQVAHGESGYLISPGDIEDLQGRIEVLLTTSILRKKMSEKAIKSVEKFDVKSKRAEFLNMYHELVDEI